MTIAHLLEDFGTTPGSGARRVSDEDIEADKLESFETGYRAGWEDALKSRSEESERISDEFARNLQDLSFTYHEAHAQVMKAMGPLLQDIVEKILPDTVRETLGLRVAEQLTEMARIHGARPMEIVTAPTDLTAVEGLLTQDFGFPVRATADDMLTDGQVLLRMAGDERQIDMDAVMEGIRQAVAGLRDESERTLKHG